MLPIMLLIRMEMCVKFFHRNACKICFRESSKTFSFYPIPILALAPIQEKPLQWNIFWHSVEIAVLDVRALIYAWVPKSLHKQDLFFLKKKIRNISNWKRDVCRIYPKIACYNEPSMGDVFKSPSLHGKFLLILRDYNWRGEHSGISAWKLPNVCYWTPVCVVCWRNFRGEMSQIVCIQIISDG